MNKDETIRLEALSLSLKSFASISVASENIVIDRAKKFEEYIKTGETNE